MHPDVRMSHEERARMALAYAGLWAVFLYILLLMAFPLAVVIITALGVGLAVALKRRGMKADLPDEPIGRD